jgi:hypothetical protein
MAQSDENANLPPPKPGDVIYLPTSLYLSHGRDDFQGGRCIVSGVKDGISGGAPAVYVSVKERSGHSYNWAFLGPEQAELQKRFGEAPGHPDPDYREEFNEI